MQNSIAYPEALHVGLTATPYRADGRGLGDVYRRLVIVATPRQLMDQGHLVEPRCFTHPVKPNLKGIKTIAGDYNQEELGAAMDKRELVGNLVEHWGRLSEGHRTVVFATNVAHSRNIVDVFRGAGVAAEHLDGETPSLERKAILRRLDAGATRVVSNAMVLCEGWDQPSVKCCVLAAPTKSRAKYIQQKGRVVRPWEGVTPTVLDHAGNILEHGLLQDDFEITLEGRSKKDKQTVTTKECPGCQMLVPGNTAVCPNCSMPFGQSDPDEGKVLNEKDGQLVEVRAGERTARLLDEIQVDLRRPHTTDELLLPLSGGPSQGGADWGREIVQTSPRWGEAGYVARLSDGSTEVVLDTIAARTGGAGPAYEALMWLRCESGVNGDGLRAGGAPVLRELLGYLGYRFVPAEIRERFDASREALDLGAPIRGRWAMEAAMRAWWRSGC